MYRYSYLVRYLTTIAMNVCIPSTGIYSRAIQSALNAKLIPVQVCEGGLLYSIGICA